jgi:hypothetical protein
MTDSEWIAFRTAVVMVGGARPVLDALMTGQIRSQGRKDYGELEELTADHWATMTFLPVFKEAGSMRKFDWLVPRGKERVRVCTGFGDIRLLRADVERRAEATTPISPPRTELDEMIRKLLDEDPDMASEKARKKCANYAGVIPPKNKFAPLWREAQGPRNPGRKTTKRAAE